MLEVQCPACAHRFDPREQRPRVERPPQVFVQGNQMCLWLHGGVRDLRWGARLVGVAAVSLSLGAVWVGEPLLALPAGIVGWPLMTYLQTLTYVEADSTRLRVGTRPGTAVDLLRRDVEQLYVTKAGELRAVRKTGVHVALLKGPPAVMRYLEQRLEAQLGLEDAPLADEWWEARACPECGQVPPRQLVPVSRPPGVQEERRAGWLRWRHRFTVLQADLERLTVRSSPWGTARALERAQVKALCVVAIPSKVTSYCLEALLVDGSRVRLLGPLKNEEGPAYLEQELELFWKLENRGVA